MYTPMDIANWFLAVTDRDAGDSITHLKLQKLVYYAQAWSFAVMDRQLFAENFQGWTHGPVSPTVFRAFNGCGWSALPAPSSPLPDFDRETIALLQNVYVIYGGMHARQLERQTHLESPWIESRKGLLPDQHGHEEIKNMTIVRYYRALLEGHEYQGPNVNAFRVLPITANTRQLDLNPSENEVDDVFADQVIAELMEEYDEAWEQLARI